ncbi:tetratricopeptide repeat protein [Streptomyces sp. NPDC087440]|uniref:tetratricopeptide repeat protein n=1 Tax=Streptomyces sp. NPDC087440 TaxID=3365790 RepID=UPI0037FA64BD
MSDHILSPHDVREALWENRRAPNGPVRNARGEQLVAAAETTGDPGLVRLALFELISAYEYSVERGRMMVPFARLLQEWDKDPSGFDSSDVYRFHWMFKWVTSGMLTLPEIPLSSIEGWLVEMQHRYSLGGYSERAVRQAEFELAQDTGDTERAERAFAAWTAAERDEMANCHACETNDQGHHWETRGEDAKALEVWTPVLDGRLTCAEEPHRTFAKSLLPLVRTGRTDEARSHHLRGYRMAKGNESLLPSIGLHIEFCALTGNEGRGLEILAEHAGHLSSEGNAWTNLQFQTGVLVLLRRLVATGHGHRPVAHHDGRRHTAAELAALLEDRTEETARRFDARNGSTVVSGQRAERLARQPLTDTLPLGVRAAASVSAAPSAHSVRSAPAGSAAETVEELAVRARASRAAGHPAAAELWERIAVLRAREGAPEPEALLAAELAEHHALTVGRAGGTPVGDGTVRRLFEDVVAVYQALGEPARAAVNAVRIAVAAVQQGASDEEIRAALHAADALVEEIPADDPLRTYREATAALTRIKLETFIAQRAHAHRSHAERSHAERDGAGREEAGHEEAGHDGGFEAEAHARFLAAMSGFAERYGTGEAAGRLSDLVAEAEVALAHDAVDTQDWKRAEDLLTSAARRNQEAGKPWEAAEPLTGLARLRLMLGRPDLAEEAARTALECAAELVDAEERGTVRLALAEALYQQDGKEAEAATYALEAAHWFDAAGDGAGAGASARLVLAQAFGASGRAAEGAEILESALPDLLEHGDEQAVRARDTLGRLLRQLGDEKAAAEQYLLAAETAEAWDHPAPKARLAMLAAECLAGADGLEEQAAQAYERAVGLWQEAGEPFGQVRALRALAWLAAEERYDDEGEELPGDVARARELMDRALVVLDEDGPEYRLERARTWSQLSRLLYDEDGLEAESVELGIRAAEALREFGPEELGERASCVLRSAWAEQGLGRKDEGRALLETFVGELKELAGESEAAAELLRQVEQRVEHYG